MDIYYNRIKDKLIDNEVYKKTKDFSKNRYELQTYYDIGKLLIEAQGGKERAKYGDGLIREYSNRLFKDIGKKFSPTNLKNMRNFYLLFRKSQALPDRLSWSHIVELLPLNDFNKIDYYIKITKEQNLPYRDLRKRIKNNEYERLPNRTKEKLIEKQDNTIEDFIKNPIQIKSNLNYENISEKVLKQLILEDMENFLNQLGDGFAFIKSEYRIKMNNTMNYIDLLLFNYIYNCFVVVELKVTELKKEHIGQIQVYMNYINKNIKKINQDNTIGIIICKKDNQYVIDYCSDSRIFKTTFVLD